MYLFCLQYFCTIPFTSRKLFLIIKASLNVLHLIFTCMRSIKYQISSPAFFVRKYYFAPKEKL